MLRIDQATHVHAQEGCRVCRSGGPLVDTEVPIEGEGSLAICFVCILDMAATAELDVRRPKPAKK